MKKRIPETIKNLMESYSLYDQNIDSALIHIEQTQNA